MNKNHASPALQGLLLALGSALLFGLLTPIVKLIAPRVHPFVITGCMGVGSAVGLSTLLAVRYWAGGRHAPAMMKSGQWPWLLGATVFGGGLAPLCYWWGLSLTTASTASLLLNLEGVFTAALAWLVFRERVSARSVLGLLLIVAGGVVLSVSEKLAAGALGGAVLVGLAALCWGVDNNFTRVISGADPVVLVLIKNGVSGVVNLAIGLSLGHHLPAAPVTARLALGGLVGIGGSLLLFVMALRHIGAARTAACFGTAPFVSAMLAVAWLGETPGTALMVTALLMAGGVGLFLSEVR